MLALWLLWDSKPFNASCTPAAFSLHIISRYLYFNVKKGVKVITGTNSSLSPPSLQHCHSRFHLFHHLYSFTTCSTSWFNVIRLCLECLSCFLFTPFFFPSPAQSPTLCFHFPAYFCHFGGVNEAILPLYPLCFVLLPVVSLCSMLLHFILRLLVVDFFRGTFRIWKGRIIRITVCIFHLF